jgi:ribosomal protein S19
MLLKRFFILFKIKSLFGKNQIFFKKNILISKNFKKNSLFIYKGNKFRFIKINYFHIGLKLGNFVFTRKPFKFLIKSKTSSKIIKR